MQFDPGHWIIAAFTVAGVAICIICFWIRRVVKQSKRLALEAKQEAHARRIHRAAAAKAAAEEAYLKAIKIELPDGTVYLNDGTKILPDGTQILPDGTVIRPDGSPQKKRRHHTRRPMAGRAVAVATTRRAHMPSFMNWVAVAARQQHVGEPANPATRAKQKAKQQAKVKGKGKGAVMPVRQQAWM